MAAGKLDSAWFDMGRYSNLPIPNNDYELVIKVFRVSGIIEVFEIKINISDQNR